MKPKQRLINRLLCVFATCTIVTAISCTSASSEGTQSTETVTLQNVHRTDTAFMQQTKTTRSAKQQPKSAQVKSTEAIRSVEQSQQKATELWLFGPIHSPELTTPLGATGVRSIVDLRNLSVDNALQHFGAFADMELGLAVCLRWRNPESTRTKVLKTENFDTAPTQAEIDRALADLRTLVGSDEAKRMGDKLFIQFYNEVGGGPGTIPPDQAEELFAFATLAAAEIRTINSEVRICGPAVTGSQFQPRMPIDSPKFEGKKAVIDEAISWSAQYADMIDLHLHGSDGSWSRVSLDILRNRLDETQRGKTVRITCFEWSCARYPDREDDKGIRDGLRGIWKTINDFDLVCAAYGPYWPLKNKANAKVADRFGWASIVDDKGRRNPPIFETLQEIGGGGGEPVKSRNKGRRRNKIDK